MLKSYHDYYHDEIGSLLCNNINDTFPTSGEDILFSQQVKFSYSKINHNFSCALLSLQNANSCIFNTFSI